MYLIFTGFNMKILKCSIIVTACVLFLSLFISFSSTKSFAADFRTIDTTISSDEVINDDLYIAADQIEMAGTIKGDLFVSGRTIKVTGTIEGNTYLFGGQIDYS